jgi:hypothetical protein
MTEASLPGRSADLAGKLTSGANPLQGAASAAILRCSCALGARVATAQGGKARGQHSRLHLRQSVPGPASRRPIRSQVARLAKPWRGSPTTTNFRTTPGRDPRARTRGSRLAASASGTPRSSSSASARSSALISTPALRPSRRLSPMPGGGPSRSTSTSYSSGSFSFIPLERHSCVQAWSQRCRRSSAALSSR